MCVLHFFVKIIDTFIETWFREWVSLKGANGKRDKAWKWNKSKTMLSKRDCVKTLKSSQSCASDDQITKEEDIEWIRWPHWYPDKYI